MSKKITQNMLSKIYQNPVYKNIISAFLLMVIFVFAVFLRVEDFSGWQKNKMFFSYQNQYIMQNMDSYYYLQFAKDMQLGNYDEIDEKRLSPNGVKRPLIPPLLSNLAYYGNKITDIPLATIAIFIPTFLSSLLVFVVFLLSRKLSLNRLAALSAALFSIISIHYVTRTRIGVFDTDSLNVVFALLNGYLFLCFAQAKNRQYLFLILGLINTFLYFIWWDTTNSIVLLSAFVPFSVGILFFDKVKNNKTKYLILGLLTLPILYFLSAQILSYIQLIFGISYDIFPLQFKPEELSSVNLSKFIKATLNNSALFLMAIIGLIYFIKQQKITTLFIIIPIILGLLPFVAGSRFLIFSAPILAIGIGYFVQLLFCYEAQYKTIKHQFSRYISVAAVVLLGLYSSYSPNTFSMAKPAILQLEYLPLLRQLNAHTPADSYIWTSWDIGYPIHYYLDKNTFADGQFSDGEKLYYLHFPLAADNLALSANFMRFYSEQGVAGMKTLYQATGGEVEAFRWLKEVLSKKPKRAKKIIARKLPNLSTTSADLTTVEQWLSFLYPKQNKAIYLFLHQRMLKTVTWFKQGSTDLATGKGVDMPFFLGFENLLEDSTGIQNDKIIIDRQKRIITDKSTKVSRPLSHLLTRDNNGSKTTRFLRLKRQQYFAFEWDKTSGYGAVMSNELSKTSLNKLFMRKKKSDYFQAISLKSPAYQIWKVQGDVIPLFKNK